MSALPDIIRGRMSAAEKDRIVALHERGFTPGRIAQSLNRHPATVNWAMHRLGLKETSLRRGGSYFRNGVEVRPFSEAEDALLTALRVDGLTTTTIAERLTERFGHPRSPHTVNMRLVLLANMEAA